MEYALRCLPGRDRAPYAASEIGLHHQASISNCEDGYAASDSNARSAEVPDNVRAAGDRADDASVTIAPV